MTGPHIPSNLAPQLQLRDRSSTSTDTPRRSNKRSKLRPAVVLGLLAWFAASADVPLGIRGALIVALLAYELRRLARIHRVDLGSLRPRPRGGDRDY